MDRPLNRRSPIVNPARELHKYIVKNPESGVNRGYGNRGTPSVVEKIREAKRTAEAQKERRAAENSVAIAQRISYVKSENVRDVAKELARQALKNEQPLHSSGSNSKTADNVSNVIIERARALVDDCDPFVEFTLVGDFDTFPLKLEQRSAGDNGTIMLRPVLIDACGVSALWTEHRQAKYGLRWFEDQPRGPTDIVGKKVLCMKPIAWLCVHFLILGHKVTVLAPDYYSQICVDGVDKVDNREAWNTLQECGLLSICGDAETSTWVCHLQIEASKVDACLISDSRHCRDNMPAGDLTVGHIDSWERMITPTFIGRSMTVGYEPFLMSVCLEFTVVMPKQAAIKRNLLTYKYETKAGRRIGVEQSFVYVPRKENLEYNEVTDNYGVRLQEQLTIESQMKQLNAIIGLFPLKRTLIRAYQVLIVTHALLKEKANMFESACSREEHVSEADSVSSVFDPYYTAREHNVPSSSTAEREQTFSEMLSSVFAKGPRNFAIRK